MVTPSPAARRPRSAAKPSRSSASAPKARAGDPAGPAPALRRLAALRRALSAGEHADSALTHMLVTDPRDVGYLTGFLGGDSYLVVPLRGSAKPILISDFRYQEELAHFEDIVRVVIRSTTMMPCLVETLAKERVERCAIQADVMTVDQRDALADQIAKRAGGNGAGSRAELVSTRGVLLKLRAVKDDSEIDLIRKAVKIQQESLLAVLPTIRPGQTELAIAARLESEMKTRGSVEPAFTSIVAARANGSLPHYRPGPVKTARNQPLLIDWGAIWNGYRSDMTRTFTLGRWPKEIREIYHVVLEAHQLAAAALKPGATTAQIDKVARDCISAAGYGERFGHGLGHGIGFNVHEEPRLTQQVAPTPLEAGMVVTIEPGIYLPGVGGVRLENDYAITANGSRCLCTLPMDIEWATLD